MNARNSALHEILSNIADRIIQAANQAAFFMLNVRQKIRYYFIFGTTDPYARMLRVMEEDEKRWKNL